MPSTAHRLTNRKSSFAPAVSTAPLGWCRAPHPQLQAQPQLQPESEPLVSPVRLGEHGAVGFGVSSC